MSLGRCIFMKIITEGRAYVQNNDIINLSKTDERIPASIISSIFYEIDDTNRYEFVCFENPADIEFFSNLEWLIDYNEIKDLSESEICSLWKKNVEDHKKCSSKYEEMDDETKKKCVGLVFLCKKLQFKVEGLEDMLYFKKGKIDINLPEGIERPIIIDNKKGIRKLIEVLKK